MVFYQARLADAGLTDASNPFAVRDNENITRSDIPRFTRVVERGTTR